VEHAEDGHRSLSADLVYLPHHKMVKTRFAKNQYRPTDLLVKQLSEGF
jgi:hypothetical protein